MDASGHKRGLRVLILLGAVYLLAGITFGALAGGAASIQMRTAWRLAAWLTSAVAFGAHIWYEQFRLRNSTIATAVHASLAAALGAFALAVAANLHAQWTASGNRRLPSLRARRERDASISRMAPYCPAHGKGIVQHDFRSDQRTDLSEAVTYLARRAHRGAAVVGQVRRPRGVPRGSDIRGDGRTRG